MRDFPRFAEPEPGLTGAWPAPPIHPGPPPPSSAEPAWRDYAPKHPGGTFWQRASDALSGARLNRSSLATHLFETEMATWKRERVARERAERRHAEATALFDRTAADYGRRRADLEAELGRARAAHERRASAWEAARFADETETRALLASAENGDGDAIEEVAERVVEATTLPFPLSGGVEARFADEDGVLLVEVEVPDLARSGMVVHLKTKDREATEREVRVAQEHVVHSLPIRLMHEILSTPELGAVRMVGVNMRLRHVDRRTGRMRDDLVGSLAATRGEIEALDVARVDARECFRALKGVATPSFAEPAAVRPTLSFDEDDARIVSPREVADGLGADTNLASMDWEDFEHVVRELFARMFSARSAAAEVHVTRASRDYGVDAIVHDPDPIHGGKFVVQAKRYVNTVDVAAVRDLFGTVQNEGANRGYLVTTSSFGPDAHAFAKGKPITLVDGPHLLRLLADNGWSFRIDLGEARRALRER